MNGGLRHTGLTRECGLAEGMCGHELTQIVWKKIAMRGVLALRLTLHAIYSMLNYFRILFHYELKANGCRHKLSA